VLSGFGEDPD